MDWIQILREFGVPTLYAIIMLAYFFREQSFLQREARQKLDEIQTQQEKNEITLDNIASDVDVIASSCRSINDQGSAQAEKLRDMFTYFINRRGGNNGDDVTGKR